MPDFEHPIAVYYDAGGDKKIIRAQDLSDDDLFELASKLAATGRLTDQSEERNLFVRTESTRSSRHFFCRDEMNVSRIYDGERDPIHDAHVQFRLRELKSRPTWTWATNGIGFADYEWSEEVCRILSEDVSVRHDIYGQPRGLTMSRARPWVAIEVINLHYPEETAFTAFLTASRSIPLVIFFDLVRKGAFYLKMNSEDGRLLGRFYVYKGCVWKWGKRIDVTTSKQLRKAMLDEENRPRP